MRFLFVAFLVSVLDIQGYASQYKFNSYTTVDGLSNDYVECMKVDADGFLWIGTYDGLNRFDGRSFRVYRHNPTNPRSISKGAIVRICQDEEKRIWVCTQQGLCLYNPLEDNFSHVKSFEGKYCVNVFEDSRGCMWVLTNTGLYKYDTRNGKPTRITFPHEQFDDHKININQGILHRDTLWLLTLNDKIVRLAVNNLHCSEFAIDPQVKSQLVALSDIMITPEGKIWVGAYAKGVFVFENSGKLLSWFSHSDDAPGTIGSNNVWAFFQDSKKRVWVQCINGNLNLFNQYSGKFKRFVPQRFDDQSIAATSITCMAEDAHGNLWVGSHAAGLQCINVNRNRFENFNPAFPFNNFASNNITCFYSADGANVWVGTNDAGLLSYNLYTRANENITTKQGMCSNTITDIKQDGNGMLWLATWGNGICKYDPVKGTCRNFDGSNIDSTRFNVLNIRSLFLDGDTLWIANHDGQLCYFNTREERFHRLGEPMASSFPNSAVNTSIMKDSRGRLWFTSMHGLYIVAGGKPCIVGKGQEVFREQYVQKAYTDNNGNIWVIGEPGLFRYTESRGFERIDLVSDATHNLMSIIASDDGNLWMGTGNGLLEYNPRRNELTQYTTEDGLSSNVFTFNSAFKLPNGKILFGGLNGFIQVDPTKIIKNSRIPRVYLSGLSIFNDVQVPGKRGSVLKRDLMYTDTVEISYDQSMFSISFAAVDMFSNRQVHLEYRMRGFNDQWTASPRHNVVTFTNLDPGEYTLEVKARNSDGVWSKKNASLHIIVTPPWWKTLWFKILVALSAAALLVQWYIRLRMQKKQLKRLVDKRTMDLTEALEELNIQNELIVMQKHEVEEQKTDLQHYNLLLTSSIGYAKHIQEAILPEKALWDFFTGGYFIMYEPLNIVSGDFYWVKHVGEYSFIVVADCTGHGVPGAFMSIMGVSFLNELIDDNCHMQPAGILNALREKIIEALHQRTDENPSADGMDMILCRLNRATLELQYANAFTSLYIARENQEPAVIEKLTADKMPVGIYVVDAPFTNKTVQLSAGDVLYLTTDGYADQMNKKTGKKLLTRRMLEIFRSVAHKPMNERYEVVSRAFAEWKGNNHQIDDVTVVAIRV